MERKEEKIFISDSGGNAASSSWLEQNTKMAGKPVQELLLNPENLPINYIYEEGGTGFRDALIPSQDEDIPVVDLNRLSSPSTAQQELAKLRHALHSWGCFQVHHHPFLLYRSAPL